MTPALSTTAWMLHDLGLATGFGGSLYGRYALHPAVRKIHDEQEKGEVVSKAWRIFSPVNLLSHLTFALTWLAGRSMITGRSIDRQTRRLVLAKDALVTASVATGVGSIVTGYALSRSRENRPPPIESGGTPSIETPERSRRLMQGTRLLGGANLIAIAGVIGITAVLAMKAGKSHRWPLVARLLP